MAVIEPITAMNGVLLFGWSTAVLFDVIRTVEETCGTGRRAPIDAAIPLSTMRAAGLRRKEPMQLRTIAAFDRIEENAFAVLARATELAAKGRDIINLGIGQPDFRTPEFIVEAAVKALRDGHHGYTPAVGILPLREAVAADLHKRFKVSVSPGEVMIMPGGKPTMFMSILMFGEPGADILYPDPGFPLDDRIYRRATDPGADPRRTISRSRPRRRSS